MRRRAPVLWAWAGFALAHAVAAALGWIWPNQPMGDTVLVYDPWSRAALDGTAIMGVTEPWVYPPLAIAPMMIAQLIAPLAGYELAWVLVVSACDAAAFAVLVGRGRSRSRLTAAWGWSGLLVLLGPIALFRLDAVTVPLAVTGLLLVRARPAVAGALLAAGAWIKVWPAALLAAAFCALRVRGRIAAGAAACSAAIVVIALAGGGAPHLFGFVTQQTDRGLQIEAPAATAYMWGAGAGLDGWWQFYDPDILTFQVTGPGIDGVIGALTPLLALAAAALCAVGFWKARRGSGSLALLPPLALALTAAFIVVNKVGSPQFHAWLIPPLVLWIAWDRRGAVVPACLAAVSCALTHAIYPVAYHLLLASDTVAIALLTARNLVLVALLAWATAHVVRASERVREPIRS